MDLFKKCSSCKEEKPVSCFSKKGPRLQPKCKTCQSAYNKKYYSKNKENLLEYNKKYYEENRENILSQKADYRASNRAEISDRNKGYYQKSKDRFKDYRRSRRKRLKLATPSWLSRDHWAEIESTYNLARDCQIVSGELYHVDHIVPLKGKNVCGLHVPWNLQVLPADINQSKHNKELPDYD